ncbi:DUF1317 family protein [Enterobacter chengduensis]|uniref:DUF1317 family protein n=1 Tax=Enterobacter chengduensis TaxID=2494701 RepID=UPI003D6F5530
MTHAHDDIRVGTVCLPFIGNGWLMPWGEVVSNPLKAQRRAAVPGCQTCAYCQSVIELRNKQRGLS